MNVKRTTIISLQVTASEIVRALKASYPDVMDLQALPDTATILTGSGEYSMATLRASKDTSLPTPVDPA